jgi:hypothetical protein
MMRIGKGTEVTAAAPVFTITSATCMMARKVLSIESRSKLEAMWSAMPLRVPFEQTRTSVNWFGIGAQDINLSNQLAGPTPSAVMVFLVPDAAINQTSNGETNPAQLYPGDGSVLQNVSLSVGGYRKYPIQSLSLVSNNNADPNISGSSLDVGTAYELYRACANEQPFLNDIVRFKTRCACDWRPSACVPLCFNLLTFTPQTIHICRTSQTSCPCAFKSVEAKNRGT